MMYELIFRELIKNGIKVDVSILIEITDLMRRCRTGEYTSSVTDKESLDSIFNNVDIVFHTAAVISLERRNKDLIRSVNVEGTRNVCEASLKHKINKLIHFHQLMRSIDIPWKTHCLKVDH